MIETLLFHKSHNFLHNCLCVQLKEWTNNKMVDIGMSLFTMQVVVRVMIHVKVNWIFYTLGVWTESVKIPNILIFIYSDFMDWNKADYCL